MSKCAEMLCPNTVPKHGDFCEAHDDIHNNGYSEEHVILLMEERNDYEKLYLDAVKLLRNAPRPELYFDEHRFGHFPYDPGFGAWYHSPARREHIVRVYGEVCPHTDIRYDGPIPKTWSCMACKEVIMQGNKSGTCDICKKQRAVGPQNKCARCACRGPDGHEEKQT